MTNQIKKGGNGDGGTPKVRFHYLKSTQYRVIHSDGAIGGVSAHGYINFSLYSERQAIPREQVFPVMPNGKLGEPIDSESVSREGMVREMDVNVIMGLEQAKSVKDMLEKLITNLSIQLETVKKAQQK